LHKSSSPRSDVDRLSPREREILSHLVEGHSNKGIARILGITEATVKVHLKSVQRKIRVENRTQAAIWALANLPEPGDPGFV
jgi:two-component system nitrate/nitrite response regulator NarL